MFRVFISLLIESCAASVVICKSRVALNATNTKESTTASANIRAVLTLSKARAEIFNHISQLLPSLFSVSIHERSRHNSKLWSVSQFVLNNLSAKRNCQSIAGNLRHSIFSLRFSQAAHFAIVCSCAKVFARKGLSIKKILALCCYCMIMTSIFKPVTTVLFDMDGLLLSKFLIEDN